MAQQLNLNAIKSSGVYTFEIDESQNLSLPISTGRLVIGSSKQGPINSIVLVNDSRTENAVYGDVDTKLEKKGSFFHRTIAVGLRQGPVYAMNILPVTNDDVAYFRTFNTESASNNSIWSTNQFVSPVSTYYNIQKLWFADNDVIAKTKNYVLGDDTILSPTTIGNVDKDANKIFTIANLSRKNITAWVRIADVTGYDITVRNYYKLLGEKVEVPEFLNLDDYIQDFFVEVTVVEGDWTNYLKLSNDPIYSQYFTSTGIIAGKLNDFVSLREVNLLAKEIGCIIPDFKDLAGNLVAIDTIFNRKFPQTGVFVSLDHKKVDLIDLTETAFDSGSAAEPMAEQRLDVVGHGVDELNITNGTHVKYVVDDGLAAVDPVRLIDVLSYSKPIDSTFYFLLSTYVPTYVAGKTYIAPGGEIIAVQDSYLYNAWINGYVVNGDKVMYLDPSSNPTTSYLGSDGIIRTQGSVKYIIMNTYSDVTRLNVISANSFADSGNDYLWIVKATASAYRKDFDITDSAYFLQRPLDFPNSITKNVVTVYIAPELYGNPAKNEVSNTAVGFPYDSAKRAEIDNFFKVGQYIKAKVQNERGRMLRITSVFAQKTIIPNYGPSSVSVTVLKYVITVASPADINNLGIDAGVNDTTFRAYKGVKNFATSLRGYYVPAEVLDDINLYPDGTPERQHEILDFLFNGSNLGSTLADNQTLEYRYLIDSYEGQIFPSSKQELAQLAANHGKVLAIANAPSFAQYERSVSPSFIDLTTRLVSTEAISTGGDLNSNPEFLFTFASGEKNGIPLASFISYFMPNLVIFEAGKNKSIPPAMYVANAFMNKYTSGNVFSIVAGKRGIISDPEVVGVEYDLTNEDRDFLEPAGFNLIVRRRGFGIMIFSNNTGYQTVQSALNNTHVREALVTIERDIERILLNFLFDWNDVTTRLRVKTMVKNYLEAVMDARGITWYDVIFDDSNNTSEVLENNAGVIDILVDFPRGIHKFINRITITRVGGQLSSQSTGFTPSF